MKSGYYSFCIIFIILLCLLAFATGGSPVRQAGPAIGRIVSLSPSLTDQVDDLGASDMLAGVTMFNPEYRGNAEVLGSYVSPDIERIIRLRPDIVLVSDEDSIQTSLLAGRFGLRCFRFGRVFSFEDICLNYMELAGLIGRSGYGRRKLESYRARLGRIKKPERIPRVVFLVSARPLITVSGGSYINSIINFSGGQNLFEGETGPYPILSVESLVTRDPDAVITMNIGDRDYITHIFKDYRHLRFARKNNIFAAGDSSIPYYSPERYVESVEQFSAIFSEIKL